MRPALLLRGIRAVAVDLDGTMVDTLLDFHAAVNRMRDGLGLAALDSATIARFVGRGSEHLMRQVLALDFDEVGVAHHLDAAMSNYLGH